MKRGLFALLLSGWVAACTDGSLTVHTRFWGSMEGERATSAHILLGDGSQYLQPLDPSGDVTFEGSSLDGPQDITLVAHYDSGNTQAFTWLAVGSSEVWLPFAPKFSPAPPGPQPQRAVITGKVSGRVSPTQTLIHARGAGVSGLGIVADDGSYRVQVQGTLPAVVDLLAEQVDFESPTVGLRQNIAVSEGQEVSGQDISLDHPFNQELRLNISGAEAYPLTYGAARLYFSFGKGFLLTTHRNAEGNPPRLPTSMPILALTAPFDTVHPLLSVEVGAGYVLPAGRATAQVSIKDLSPVTLSLPKPMTLASPTLGPQTQPSTASSKDLSFHWSADPAAQRVSLRIYPQRDLSSPSSGFFFWSVTAPGSVTSFTPFTLPAQVGPSVPFSQGLYGIELGSSFADGLSGYDDAFVETRKVSTQTWSTSLSGTLSLQ